MYELLSRRENGLPEMQFDVVKEKCRNQFVTLFYRAMEDLKIIPAEIYDDLRMYLGLKPLSPNTIPVFNDEMDDITRNLDDSQFKDLIDLVCQIIYDEASKDRHFDYNSFAGDVNHVLRENGLGYKVCNGHLIKYHDEYEYSRLIEPGFEILSENGFEDSKQYLLNSFECYKSENNSGAIVEITRALEATINSIALRMGVNFDQRQIDGSKLHVKIKELLSEGLIPRYYESYFNTLTKLLSEATVRNKEGAHAKTGSEPTDDYVVLYALDQTMSSILFLVRAFIDWSAKNKKRSKKP